MVSYARQPTRVRLGEQTIRIEGLDLTLTLDPSIEPKVLSHYVCKWLSEREIEDYRLEDGGHLYRNRLPLELRFTLSQFCLGSYTYFVVDSTFPPPDIIIRLLLALAEYKAVEG